jgi:acyl carrier protein
LAPGSWDAVILNSVVQYFPSVEYLLRVLEGAVRLLAPGGVVFIGDVRSLPLLEVFHASVQVQRAPATLSRAQLRQRVQDSLHTEAELVIDPEFFWALPERLRQIRQVEMQLKRGETHNELTRFRYDVILHVGEVESSKSLLEVPWLEWQQAGLTVAGLRQRLLETPSEVLGVRGVPNARVQEAVRLVELLHAEGGPVTVGELCDAVQVAPVEVGVDPEAMWALGEEMSYTVMLSESGPEAPGCFNVVLQRQGALGERPWLAGLRVVGLGRSWASYATQPLQGQWLRQLGPQLRQYLNQRVPEYMVPGTFVVLETLPLTPNGKVDRRALPVPDPGRRGHVGGYVAPRTATEVRVAALWGEVLGLTQVGLHDNFFEWGGHSLLATQLISRVREAFQVEIPLRDLFETPTVADLAERIETVRWALQGLQTPPSTMVDDREEGTL